MRRGERLVLGGSVTLLAVSSLIPGPSCMTVSLVDPIVIRVDGTTLTDWEASAPMGSALEGAATAILLVPDRIGDAPRIGVPGEPDWFDQGLGGRRYLAATLAVGGSRAEPDPRLATLPTGQGPGQLPAATTGTFASSASYARPIAISGRTVLVGRADANWPTGGRANLDAMRREITGGGPIELDVGDIWRLDHSRISGTARDAFVTEAFTNTVAPLITSARETSRPVVVVSLLPPVHEQRADRWRGAVAVIAPGLSGAASQPRLAGNGRSGLASAPTVPGTIDISRLLGALGLPRLGEGPVHDPDHLCVAGGTWDAAALDRSLAAAADVHDQATTVALGVLALAALAAGWLLRGNRRRAIARVPVEIVGVTALLSPLVAFIEGSLGGSVALRVGVWVAGLAVSIALVAILGARMAIVASAGAGVAAGALQLVTFGQGGNASILAAPLFRGLRAEGPEAFVLAGFAVGAATLLSWWIDARREGRGVRAFAALPVAGIVIVAMLRGGLPPWAAAMLVVVVLAPASTLIPRVARRMLLLGSAATLVLGVHVWRVAPATSADLEAIVSARAMAQPKLWPVLALVLAVVLVARIRLGRRQGEVLGRLGFGWPAWRAAEATLLVVAVLIGFGIAAGMYASVLIASQAAVVGRVR